MRFVTGFICIFHAVDWARNSLPRPRPKSRSPLTCICSLFLALNNMAPAGSHQCGSGVPKGIRTPTPGTTEGDRGRGAGNRRRVHVGGHQHSNVRLLKTGLPSSLWSMYISESIVNVNKEPSTLCSFNCKNNSILNVKYIVLSFIKSNFVKQLKKKCLYFLLKIRYTLYKSLALFLSFCETF